MKVTHRIVWIRGTEVKRHRRARRWHVHVARADICCGPGRDRLDYEMADQQVRGAGGCKDTRMLQERAAPGSQRLRAAQKDQRGAGHEQESGGLVGEKGDQQKQPRQDGARHMPAAENRRQTARTAGPLQYQQRQENKREHGQVAGGDGRRCEYLEARQRKE